MNAAAPWSVKGIDPKARKAAKELARRSGMTLGEWLNRVILEDDVPEEVTVEAEFAGRPRRTSHDATPEPQRLGRLPADDALENARAAKLIAGLTDHIEASETRTGLAISGVEHAVRSALDRVETTEREQAAAAARLQMSLTTLSSEQAKFSERLRGLEAEPAGPRSAEALRALEGRLAGTLAEQVEAVRAEVAARLQLPGGGALDARLNDMAEHVRAAERRSTQVVEQIGRQVLAMAEAVSRKLAEVDDRSAEAIDQVGSEVARIASAVELRLARAEHAQSEAFERLGSELAQVSARLAPADQPPAAAAASAVATPPTDPEPLFTAFAPGGQEEDPNEAQDTIVKADELPPPPAPEPEARLEPTAYVRPVAAQVQPAFSQWAALSPEVLARAEDVLPKAEPPAFDADQGGQPQSGFSPLADADDEVFEAESRLLPEGALPPLSTREVIEQARAAARAARAISGAGAKRDRNAATGRFFRGFGVRSAKTNSTLQTALVVAGGAAFLSVGAAGLSLMERREAQDQVAVAPLAGSTRAGIALGPAGFAPAGQAAGVTDPAVEFPRVQADLEAGRSTAIDRLTALAAHGYPPAQLYLAQLLESGSGGLAQNLTEARRLTTLAAESGEPRAMHNLAVYFFRGDGGPQDLASAAQWFRKAAEVGVVESQFNLGLLYQSGSGVTRDLAQARQWFEKAAASGDAEAREAALALDPKAVAVRATAPLEVRDAQRILVRLGYFRGAVNGAPSPAFRAALATYQRQHGRQPTGALDPATVSALSVYRR